MEIQHMVYFEPDPDDSSAGHLFISKHCVLDDLYQHPQTPIILKNTLEKLVTWHVRNETTVGKALRSTNHFPQFQGYIHALGIDTTDQYLSIPLGYGHLHIHYADVRPTPADEPIVSAFVCIKIIDAIIQDIGVTVTGAHSVSPYKIQSTKLLTGKPPVSNLLHSLMGFVDDELKPESDYRGSSEYRLAMAKVVIKRAFLQCVEEN